MKLNLYLTVPAFVLLAACGGGSGGSVEQDPPRETAEVSEEEIENNDALDEVVEENEETPTTPTVPAVPENFTLANQNVIFTERLPVGQRMPEAATETFELTLNTDGTATLTKGALSVVMSADANGIFTGTVGQGVADEEFGGFFDPRFQAGDVGTALIIATDFTTRTEAFVPVGTPTGAAAANALTGVATYRGLMNARITGPNATAFPEPINGLGGGRLTFDFDAGTVEGRFDLRDPNNNFDEIALDDEFPRILVELNSSSITDGAFNGTAAVTFKDGGGLWNPALAASGDGTFSANLFGDTGGSAGGTVVSTLDNNGEDFVFQGGFATENRE